MSCSIEGMIENSLEEISGCLCIFWISQTAEIPCLEGFCQKKIMVLDYLNVKVCYIPVEGNEEAKTATG